jgi:hypothetical protein
MDKKVVFKIHISLRTVLQYLLASNIVPFMAVTEL